jgi:hypothetical protein
MPAAVKADTVADPIHIRKSAAIIHPRISGDKLEWLSKPAM